jgi:basic membrane lipoprotein Med (substrate-binding protein (PBP1-ABC) superfamily)
LNVTLLPTVYLGGYDNVSLAGNTTFQMFTAGKVSVLFAPVRAAIVGVRNGMLFANSTILYLKHRMPFVIAAEGNLDYYGCSNILSPVAPSWIPTSIVSHAERAIFRIINATLWNAFPAHQQFKYDLANGGVNVTAFSYSSTYIPPSVVSIISSYKDAIVSGTISVAP